MPEKMVSRQRFLIKSDLQLGILWYILIGMTLVFFICALVIGALVNLLMVTVTHITPEMQTPIIAAIAHELTKVTVTFLLLVVFMSLSSIFFSNRMAGPVYRIEEDLKRMMAERRLFPIRVRQHDYITKLVGIINEFLEKVDFKPSR